MSVVWTGCPKNTFVSKSVFEIAIHSAVPHFSDGTDGVRDVFFKLSFVWYSNK